VLDGLLRYRSGLHQAGFTSGFQWLDGSFLEDIEEIEGRPPNDIDVVTFFQLPLELKQADLKLQFPELFPSTREEQDKLKSSFRVDAYLVDLGGTSESLVSMSAYWYGLWSHRRNQLWKGFLQVDLAPADDATATYNLSKMSSDGNTA